MTVITVSRSGGSLGDELAYYLADKLACEVVDRDYILDNILKDISEEKREILESGAKAFLKEYREGITYKDFIVSGLREMAGQGNLVILGNGGCIALADNPDAIHIRVDAGIRTRTARLSKRYNISADEAESLINIGDRKHKRFVSLVYGADITDKGLFDIIFDTDRLSVDECAEAVMALAARRSKRREMEIRTSSDDTYDHQTKTPVFKNETEREFARILDAYLIEWMYEPKTFPIEWDAEGNIKMAFAPDFYLPKFDLYLELTTMEQKYVTRKNKKARKVMELYPGTNVRIVYKKDFEELVSRLGRFGGN